MDLSHVQNKDETSKRSIILDELSQNEGPWIHNQDNEIDGDAY